MKKVIAIGNGLYEEGKEWPPLIRDDGGASPDFFKLIADLLNSYPKVYRYNFIVDTLRKFKDSDDLKSVVNNILTIIDNDEKRRLENG